MPVTQVNIITNFRPNFRDDKTIHTSRAAPPSASPGNLDCERGVAVDGTKGRGAGKGEAG